MDWAVRVVSWPDGAVVAVNQFQGDDPPQTCTVTSRSYNCLGPEPQTAAQNWLNTVITH
jgi:hypothetical protein